MCGFQRGRYVNLTDEVKRELAEKKLDDLQASAGLDEKEPDAKTD